MTATSVGVLGRRSWSRSQSSQCAVQSIKGRTSKRSWSPAALPCAQPWKEPQLGVLNANLNTALNGVLDARPSLGDVVVVSGLAW